MEVDLIVIGGGAAGLMAACAAGAAGRRVLVLERMPGPGRKLLATGGGRCNLTTSAAPEAVLRGFGRHGAFMRPALQALPPEAIRAFFAAAGVPTVAQSDGCVFPQSQRAVDVLRALQQVAARNGAVLRCGATVEAIWIADGAVRGVVVAGERIAAPRVLLAAGGCSYAALGSDGSGFGLATAAGHRIVTPVPALVPLVVSEDWARQLPGLVLPAGRVRLDAKGAPKAGHVGPVLFTHRGLSGPPVLDLSGEIAARLAAAQSSEGAAGGVPIRLALSADRDRGAWLALFEAWRREHGGRALHNLLAGEVPRALALSLSELAELRDKAVAQARRTQLEHLAQLCADLPLTVVATEGWTQAMVTRGGVALDEIDPATLCSRLVRGLAFAGEVVDLDGPCGGYNLTWAFASGRLAGRGAAEPS